MNTPEASPVAASKAEAFALPAVSLPKGGGALRGIGETFAANAATGTGSLALPLPISPGRSGFTPALALGYDSGSGNGPYGFGWSIGYPSIARRTDRGLPQYADRDETDVFVLSGAEDMVPVVRSNGSRAEDVRDGFLVARYRPRVEGLFARIERWSSLDDPADIHWRSISRDNITSLYGTTPASRIADPSNAARIFTWLLCESFDDAGNAARYDYTPEDGRNVDTSLASERNRTDLGRSANRYLKRVRYGNRSSRLVQPDLAQMEWLFELVMDYGDHDADHPAPEPIRSWSVRPDPFSAYRAGFEIRTYRRCQRILMFHRFAELGPQPKLVRSLALDYDDFGYPSGFDTRAELEHPGSSRIGSLLRGVTLTCYGDNGAAASMPPLELAYSRPRISEDTRTLDEASYVNLPGGVDGARYQWIDLNGDGLSGVLSEQGEGWWYKPNLGDGRLGPQQLVVPMPSLAPDMRAHFFDLAGTGRLDIVRLDGPDAGFFERDDDQGWSAFTPFVSQANVDWRDRNLRLVDLTGDGHPDILITEDEVISFHRSLGKDGFGTRESMQMEADESLGPRLVFDDATETVFVADMSGDGLSDIVRIRSGEVCYWPNVGYGRFGPKVTMDDAPVLDAPEQFDPRRVRLADIDGSGVADFIYLGGDGVRLHFNRSGNGWSKPHVLASFPPIDNVASVEVTDLLGNGTACLAWSTPLPDAAATPLRYVDLMGSEKPHLLTGVDNNLGARTLVRYTTSTRAFLDDQLAGRAWVTRLPFPVHVVERIDTYDDVGKSRFVTRFAYHHGYFDGAEREFRGFGMVERWDTEEFAALNAGQELAPASNVDASSHVPPALTRSWFHTGVYLGRNRVSSFFAGLLDERDVGEYYREPGLDDAQARRLTLDDTILPDGLAVDEEREACRALKGRMLRQETFALDGSPREAHPYSVVEQNFTVRLLQPKGGNAHAVCFAHGRESLAYHYERRPADPRVAHDVTLEVDDFGNVLKSAVVGYGRRTPDPALEARNQQQQADLHVTCAQVRVTNGIDTLDEYRAPLDFESTAFELTGLELPADRDRFTFEELANAVSAAATIDYEQTPAPGVLQKRIVDRQRIVYRRNDLSGSLPLGSLESLAVPFERYRLAFTAGLIDAIYGSRVTPTMLADDGRYVHSEGDGHWWVPSGRLRLSPDPGDDAAAELARARQHFFLSRRFEDPFGHDSAVSYDAYDLLVAETRDPLGNTVTAGERGALGTVVAWSHDYRVLQPRLVTDPNGNRTAVAYDARGLVVATAVMGKRNEMPRQGDLLDGLVADLPDNVIAAHFADPLADPQAILGRATTRTLYDVFAYARTRQSATPTPATICSLARETHDADLAPGGQSAIRQGFSYLDGFGRELQRKIEAEPGPVPERDPATGRVVVVDGQPQLTDHDVSPRWVGSGWAIFNNKGKPVRQFEPFFTDSHRFESDVRIGVSPTLFYDAATRVVATLHPNHTFEKVAFDAWRQESWDVNDTLLIADPASDPDVGEFFRRLPAGDYLPTWHARRGGGELGPGEQAAAARTELHAGTPSVAHADSLGRPFLVVVHNRFKADDTPPADPPTEAFEETRVVFDIEGNRREIIDALGRVIMRCDYDLRGNRIHQLSMEAGARWMLVDVASRPIRAFDDRGHSLRTMFDAAHRSVEAYVREGSAAERLVERTVYGETVADPEAKNQRGMPVQVFDQAGVMTTEDYDFKGNLLASRRQFARDVDATLDWSANVPLEPEIHASSTRFDALNRPREQTAPDGSVLHPEYNEAKLLERMSIRLRGAPAATPFVANIDYNARGQRTRIAYGNGVTTDYTHDAATFRLVNLRTTRTSDQALLQDLTYTIDPAGNVTHIGDGAQQTLFHAGQVVAADNDYEYDATYRLSRAEGREHIGQLSLPQATWDDRFRTRLPQPGDGQAMRRYVETYAYDAEGNLLQLDHRAANGNWRRAHHYREPSLIEPATRTSNRLSDVSFDPGGLPNESFAYDAHGNMTALPHLTLMEWDFRDQLRATARQVVTSGTPETTYYAYDAAGRRARKLTVRQNGTRKSERRYLNGFEIEREYDGSGTAVRLERETLHAMDDKQRIALVETRVQGSDPGPIQLVRFQLANHVGSAALELDDAGRIISYEEYTPYGSTSYQAVRSQTETPKRYRYTAMERDDESGLGYHASRYYVPWLARWLSPDRIGPRASLNLYAYCRDNPIAFVDTNGQDPTSIGEAGDLPETATLQDIVNYARAHGYDYTGATRGTYRKTPEGGQWIVDSKFLKRHVYSEEESKSKGFGNEPGKGLDTSDMGTIKSGPYQTSTSGGDYDPFAPKAKTPPPGNAKPGKTGPAQQGGGAGGGMPNGSPQGSPTGTATTASSGQAASGSGSGSGSGDSGGGGSGDGGWLSWIADKLETILTVVAVVFVAVALWEVGAAFLLYGSFSAEGIVAGLTAASAAATPHLLAFQGYSVPRATPGGAGVNEPTLPGEPPVAIAPPATPDPAEALLTMITERVGEYEIYGSKGMVGGTFERRILILEHLGGPTTDIRPITQLMGLFEQEAQGLGASEVRIMGLDIEAKSIPRLNLILNKLGASMRVIDSKRVEITKKLK